MYPEKGVNCPVTGQNKPQLNFVNQPTSAYAHTIFDMQLHMCQVPCFLLCLAQRI